MRSTKPKYNKLEIVIRIRTHSGAIIAEQTIRGDRVELCSYWPSGRHEVAPVEISLEMYIKYLQALREDRPLEEAAGMVIESTAPEAQVPAREGLPERNRGRTLADTDSEVP